MSVQKRRRRRWGREEDEDEDEEECMGLAWTRHATARADGATPPTMARLDSMPRDDVVHATYQRDTDNSKTFREASSSSRFRDIVKLPMTQLFSALSSRVGRQRGSIGRLLSGSWECSDGSSGISALTNHYHTSGPKNDQEQSQVSGSSSFRERLARGPGLDDFIQGTYSVYAPPPKVRRFPRGSRFAPGGWKPPPEALPATD